MPGTGCLTYGENIMHENLSPTDDIVFDKLVDGELNEAERRELLSGLDEQPGGWRRCALAFLESQCWHKALPAYASYRQEEAPHQSELKPVAQVATKRTRWWQSAPGAVSAMAASFLLALGLVFWARHPGVGPEVGGQTGVPIARSDVAPQTQQRADTPHSRIVTVSEGPQPGDSFNVRATEHDNIDPRWAQAAPSPIPDNVLQALKRTGHRVDGHRELMRVALPDGRNLLVPVDQVEVRYVGGQSY
jgi:hypothetical protein